SVSQAPTPSTTPAASAQGPQPVAPSDHPLTADEGAVAEGELCLSCHSIELIESSRIGEAGWKAEIVKMRNWGALLDEEKAGRLASWFARHYPATQPASAAKQIAAADAAAAVAPERGKNPVRGDAQAGAAEYTKDCAFCHGAHAEGTGGGPVLLEAPVLYQPMRFSTLISKGEGRMPAFPLLSQVDITTLTAYRRGLR